MKSLQLICVRHAWKESTAREVCIILSHVIVLQAVNIKFGNMNVIDIMLVYIRVHKICTTSDFVVGPPGLDNPILKQSGQWGHAMKTLFTSLALCAWEFPLPQLIWQGFRRINANVTSPKWERNKEKERLLHRAHLAPALEFKINCIICHNHLILVPVRPNCLKYIEVGTFCYQSW